MSIDGESDALIGITIDDKYRIESKLGEGGMGAVYLSTRLMIGDTVAIKILHSAQVSDPQAIERFRREAQAAARLKHQNAVTIYDFGVSNEGSVYLVMELAEGQSLRDIIKQQGPVTPSAAAEIMSQVCAALDAAHRQHIVHRDMKPDNIIVEVTNTGLRVKVLDFGIAKMRDLTASNLTQTGAVMGTPYYMSPEHCMGEELDHRSDIYSLGIVLFEMLAGVVPFNSPISTAVVVQHVNQAPPSLRALNASISPAVEAVVMHALEKRREARPQTAGQLAQELIASVQGRPFTPHSGSAPVSPVYSTPASTTPTVNPATGAGLALTIQMTTPPIISGVQTELPQKRRAGWLIVGVVLVAIIGLLIWASQRRQDAQSGRQAQDNASPSSIPVGQGLTSSIDMSSSRTLQTGYSPYIAFGPDSEILACAGGCEVQLWNVSSGQRLKSIKGVNVKEGSSSCISPAGIVFSPDGNLLAVGGYDVVEVREVNTGNLLHSIPQDGAHVSDMAFSPDGRTLVFSKYDSIKVWEVHTGSLLRTEEGGNKSAAIAAGWRYGRFLEMGQLKETMSADGKFKAVISQVDYKNDNSSVIKLVRISDGSVLHTLRLLPTNVYRLQSWDFDFSADGAMLAAVSDGQTLDYYTGNRDEKKGLPYRAYVWSTSDGRQLFGLKESGVGGESKIAFSPDSRNFAISIGNKSIVRLWRARYQ
jgi:serine/threonine protein kinase